jgi:hypothetical protein
MSRARIAALALATGLGLVSGCCSNPCRPSFFPRPTACAPTCASCPTCAGCEAGLPIEGAEFGVPIQQGPILDGYVPPGVAPGVPPGVAPGVPPGVPVVPGPLTTPAPGPQVPLPLNTPPDRLVPTPAQPEPYQPSGRGFLHGV